MNFLLFLSLFFYFGQCLFSSKYIALTFTIKKAEEFAHVPAILDCLGRLKVKATFFFADGTLASAREVEILCLIDSKGHEFGYQCYSTRLVESMNINDNFIEIINRSEVFEKPTLRVIYGVRFDEDFDHPGLIKVLKRNGFFKMPLAGAEGFPLAGSDKAKGKALIVDFPIDGSVEELEKGIKLFKKRFNFISCYRYAEKVLKSIERYF
jgi:hypothetical protein